MKKIFMSLLMIAGSIFSIDCEDIEAVKVRICKVVEHEALNSVVAGIEEYLRNQEEEYQISTETCQGKMALASQIIAKFANTETNVVVTIGTMPSQCALKLAKEKKIKLIFSSVTNPSDISSDLNNSNITGVSNFVDLDPQVQLFKKLQPSLKTLGVIYNTGEANSISIIKKLRDVCKNNGIQLAEQGISTISDIPQATTKLLESSDAIFISNDNMALSGISNIIKICNQKKIPVYVSDTDQVEKGCLAALGPNQFEIGIQTGKIIKRVADGEDINNILIEYPDTSELYINLDAAKLLKIQIPNDIKSKAKKIIGG